MIQTRSQWRASASRLSPELLRMIFAWFCPHCCGSFDWQNWADRGDDEQHEHGVRSLVDLCLVSVAFRNAAQEILYHSFDSRYPTKSPSRLRLELFLRSIAGQPDLARSVKAVSLDQSSFENLDFFASRDAFDDCAHALGTSALDIWKQAEHVYRAQAQHPGCEAFFVRDADPGSWAQHPPFPFLADELLTMLVALLPNLNYLKVDSFIEDLDPSRATSNAIGLTRLPLKTLDTNLRFESLLGLSPDVETLVCRSRLQYRLSRDSLPSLQSLVFDGSSVDHRDVQHLLSACTGHLSHFSYRGPNATAEEIVRVLSTERLHATLQSIHIDCRLRNFIDRNRVMPNFRPFLNLRTLFLSIFLMHPDADSDSHALVSMLPASIESLTLMGNDVGLTYDYTQSKFTRCLRNKLLGLAEAKATASGFEHLSRVRCDAPQVYTRYVRGRFRRVGVDFVYQEFPRLVPFTTEVLGVEYGLPIPDTDDEDDL